MYQPPQQPYTQWGQYPPPPPQPKKSYRVWLLIAGVVLLLCLLGAYSGNISRLVLALEPSCSVGVTGSAATITVEAWSANQDCKNMLDGDGLVCTESGNCGAGLYLYSGTPDNPVVCEGDDQGRHIIVRDEGVLKLVGNSICESLPLTT